jgi:hypothetical protein
MVRLQQARLLAVRVSSTPCEAAVGQGELMKSKPIALGAGLVIALLTVSSCGSSSGGSSSGVARSLPRPRLDNN